MFKCEQTDTMEVGIMSLEIKSMQTHKNALLPDLTQT